MRSPASIDRSATLRSLVVAICCLAIFWGVTHFTDRMQRLYLVWGCVIAAFLFNATLAVVQFSTRGDGLFGYIIPGSCAWWGPTSDDLLNAPGSTVLRDVHVANAAVQSDADGTKTGWAIDYPRRPFMIGSLMGGPGAFMALGSLAIPLTIAVLLHLVVPRGSREKVLDRLSRSGQGGLVLLLAVMLSVGVVLLGLVSGPWYSLIFALGIGLIGILCLAAPGSRGPALGITTLALIFLGAGVLLGEYWPSIFGETRPVAPPSLVVASVSWNDGLAVFRDFPLIGSGLGTFATIHPFYKGRDVNFTTAMSSVVQLAAEAGIAGLSLVGLGFLWSLWRIVPSLKRVGSADRCLAYGLLGSTLAFTLFSSVHWSLELTAVAVCASAVGGTCNRWLAGGTDLFVERG